MHITSDIAHTTEAPNTCTVKDVGEKQRTGVNEKNYGTRKVAWLLNAMQPRHLWQTCKILETGRNFRKYGKWCKRNYGIKATGSQELRRVDLTRSIRHPQDTTSQAIYSCQFSLGAFLRNVYCQVGELVAESNELSFPLPFASVPSIAPRNSVKTPLPLRPWPWWKPSLSSTRWLDSALLTYFCRAGQIQTEQPL